MILGLGIDLLETGRVEQELSRGEWLADHGIFTSGEIRFCGAAPNPAPHYAACFAAKEATMKALGVQAIDLALFREVEVGQGSGQGYKVILHDRLKAASEQLGVRRIRLSITHSAGQAGAVVILED